MNAGPSTSAGPSLAKQESPGSSGSSSPGVHAARRLQRSRDGGSHTSDSRSPLTRHSSLRTLSRQAHRPNPRSRFSSLGQEELSEPHLSASAERGVLQRSHCPEPRWISLTENQSGRRY